MFSFLYHCQDFYPAWLSIWVTRRVSYKKRELIILHERLSSPPVFGGVRVAHLFSCCPIVCLYIVSSMLWCPLRFPHGSDVRFVFASSCFWGLVFCLRYLYLFACSGVRHVLCCVFALFFFILCTLCCPFLWNIHLWLPLSGILWGIFVRLFSVHTNSVNRLLLKMF